MVTTLQDAVAPRCFREVPGAASVALASILSRPTAPATILGVFPSAVYVQTGGEVVAVVTRDAVRLPNAVVVPFPAAEHPFGGTTSSTRATVGAGEVVIGDLVVRGTRWWDPHVEVADVDPVRVTGQLATMGRLLAAARRQPAVRVPPSLVDAWNERHIAGVIGEAERLVGLGPGLTPSGDDILAGMLGAFRVLSPDGSFADRVGKALTAMAPGRTTTLSLTLLRMAAAGQLSPEAARVLRALPSGEALQPAVAALLRLGHTSGADLAAGLLAGGIAATRSRTG